jgi:uncharacterized membrane protein YuzA (DUF378 family)
MNIRHVVCAIAAIIASIGAMIWGLVAIKPRYNLLEKISKKNKAYKQAIYYTFALCGLLSFVCTIMWILNPRFNQPN